MRSSVVPRSADSARWQRSRGHWRDGPTVCPLLWPEPSGPVPTMHLLTHEDGTAQLKLLGPSSTRHGKSSVLASNWPRQGGHLARLETLGTLYPTPVMF